MVPAQRGRESHCASERCGATRRGDYWGATRPGCANVYDDEFDRHAFGNFD